MFPGSKGIQQAASHNVSTPGQTVQVQASHPTGAGLPFSLIKDAEDGRLYQLLGQVVKLNTYDSEKCMLYITDYTENAQVAGYDKPDKQGTEGDEFDYLGMKQNFTKEWPGPWGKNTLPVTLFDPHAGFARENLKPGDLVLLTYARLRIKGDRNLEGYVHEDRKRPDKIHVRVFRDNNDERVQALMARRSEYWKMHGEPKKDTKKANKQAKKSQAKKSKAPREEGQITLRPSSSKINPHGESPLYCCGDH